MTDTVNEGGGTAYNVSISESMVLSDSTSTSLIMPISINESLQLEDIITSTANYVVSIAESMSVADSASNGDTILGIMCMTITASKSQITITARKPQITIESEDCT